MQAIHGGKANNDTIDAHTMAVLLRGGLLPQAYVYPADMRATRDLLRRRLSRTRKRAELLAHIQHTTRQDHLPEIGKKLADIANRDGVAERFPEPAVQKRMQVDLALLGSDDPRRSALAWHLVKAAQPHDAHTLSRLQTVPGIGNILRLVLRSEIHDMPRFPSVQHFVSYGRLVTWAKEAAVLFLRANPAGQKYLTRLEKKHGQGKALTLLAQQLGRAVSSLVKRHKAFARHTFLQAS